MPKSNAKGGAYERKVARDLSLWLTRGTDSKQLIRSVQSGGWRGAQTRATDEPWRHAGDLAPNGPVGEAFRRLFVVELKHRKVIDFWHFLTQGPGENIEGWWRKVTREAHAHGLVPLLIYRSNNRPEMVVTPSALGAPTVTHRPVFRIHPRQGPLLQAFPFRTLLDHVNPDEWMEEWRRWIHR